MAIYTKINAPQLEAFIADYAIGELKTCVGIADGIENTTYRVETDDSGRARHFILTLFERQHFDDLPYFVEVMRHLSESGLPTSQPVADKHDVYLKTLCERPAILTVFLPGATIVDVNEEQIRAVGEHLAKLHTAMDDFSHHRASDRGLDWCATQVTQLAPLVDADLARLLDDEVEYHGERALHDTPNLPKGTLHTDLFRDNVLFEGDTLTGIIDFYYACNGVLIYDLAVAINDWCRASDHTLNVDRARIALNAYDCERRLTPEERSLLPDALRLAALRFLVSRLTDMHFPRAGHTTHIKDPEVFRRLLVFHRDTPASL